MEKVREQARQEEGHPQGRLPKADASFATGSTGCPNVPKRILSRRAQGPERTKGDLWKKCDCAASVDATAWMGPLPAHMPTASPAQRVTAPLPGTVPIPLPTPLRSSRLTGSL